MIDMKYIPEWLEVIVWMRQFEINYWFDLEVQAG